MEHFARMRRSSQADQRQVLQELKRAREEVKRLKEVGCEREAMLGQCEAKVKAYESVAKE